jgi:hypothetical protein
MQRITVPHLVSVMFMSLFQLLVQAQGKEPPTEHPTFYRTIQIDGLSIFYREAGPKDAPTILLLHGLPSSSRMFQPLLARLSDRFHFVAPDYPGFGHSEWPDPKKFAYTFDHIAETMKHFTEANALEVHFGLRRQSEATTALFPRVNLFAEEKRCGAPLPTALQKIFIASGESRGG